MLKEPAVTQGADMIQVTGPATKVNRIKKVDVIQEQDKISSSGTVRPEKSVEGKGSCSGIVRPEEPVVLGFIKVSAAA